MISRTVIGTALIAATGLAGAEVVVSYSFTDLNGSYDDTTQVFSADAANSAALETGGDVSSLVGSKGTAQYDTGFLGLGSNDVAISFDVSNITAGGADSLGTIVITDADGDTLTATVEGFWTIINPFGFMFFSGTSADYAFTDNGDADGEFNGVTGSFDTAALDNIFYDGAISILLQNEGGFSSGDFREVSTQADGVLIPTPGALAIAGFGIFGMAAGRRRG